MTTQTRSPRGQIAANVRAELARRDIKNQDLATRLGWSLSATQRKTSGNAGLEVTDLLLIAQVLDVTVSDLLVGVSIPTGGGDPGGTPTDTYGAIYFERLREIQSAEKMSEDEQFRGPRSMAA